VTAVRNAGQVRDDCFDCRNASAIGRGKDSQELGQSQVDVRVRAVSRQNDTGADFPWSMWACQYVQWVSQAGVMGILFDFPQPSLHLEFLFVPGFPQSGSTRTYNGMMRISNSTASPAHSPHIYNLLDQRLSQQGVVLHQLMKDYAAAAPTRPTSPEELLEQVTSVFGKWSADPAQRVMPETPLAEEHLRLMDDICKIQGPEPAARLESTLVRVITNQFASNLGSPLRLPDENKLIPLSEVKPANAYSALAQRTALLGMQPHERVKEWVQLNRESFQHKPTSDVGYLRLAQKLCGGWPAEPDKADPFQKCVATFLDGIALSTSQSHAVVVQSSLVDTFARAIRRQVRELGLDRPTVAAPSVSIA